MAKKKTAKTNGFSKTLYVRIESDSSGSWPVADGALEAAVEGDGPTTIGVYTLEQVIVGRKRVEVTTK